MGNHVTVRPAGSWNEVQKTAIAAGRAYSKRKPEGTFFESRILEAPSLPLENTIILERGDDLVSALQIYDRQLSLNRHDVCIGAIGNVYTLPEYRGEGYGSQLLRYSKEFIEQKGYALSVLLSEKHEFYRTAGWEPMEYQRLKSSDPDPIHISSSENWESFDTKQHLDQIRSIYEEMKQNSNGRIARPDHLWTEWILSPESGISEDNILTYREDGDVKGYIVRTYNEDSVVCEEVGYSGVDTGKFLAQAWNTLVNDAPDTIFWEPSATQMANELDGSDQSYEFDPQDYCMIQLHDTDLISALTGAPIDSTQSVKDYITEDNQWYWSSLDDI